MGIVLLMMFAIGLIAGPVAASVLGHGLGALSQAIMTISGIVLAIVSGFALLITKLYVKSRADEAFVKTGMGGIKVVKDGGAYVIPVIHQLVKISLKTFRLDVKRQGANDALITKDNLRADLNAEFFLRVQPDDDSIKAAARSFGDSMKDLEYVEKLIEDKLVSALRTVAATKQLAELNTERDAFLKEVTRILTPDLEHNGLTLETATISKLDQTDPKTLRDDNIFDAQGRRTIAEITQAQITARNQLEREGEQARAEQDLKTRQQILAFDQARAKAEAEQQSAIAQVKAAQDQAAKQKEIEAQQAVELSVVAKQQAIEVAKQEQQKATEVAERDKQKAIADAEKLRAGAEATLAKAEADREQQRQEITTVQIKAAAEREKQQKIINAEAEAQKLFVAAQKQADANAYTVQKAAEANKAAADAEAEAVTKKAEAGAKAQEARARGDKALQMVPVDVQKEQVSVDKRRVDEVLKPTLEAREQHGKAAQDFELAQLRITKEAEVRIESAKATATLLASVSAEMKIFGTPEDVSRMTKSWMSGMAVAGAADGFVGSASDETREAVEGGLKRIGQLVGAVAEKLGVKPEPEHVPEPAAARKGDSIPAPKA